LIGDELVNVRMVRGGKGVGIRWNRYATGANPLVLPVPWCMVVRDAQWFEPDESIANVSGKISFHDGRGLIVDPLYVAAVFADLQTWLKGLTGKTSQADWATGAGGVGSIATRPPQRRFTASTCTGTSTSRPSLPRRS